VEAWVWWLVAAVGLGIPLVITAMPEFGMFAVGGVAGAVAAGLGAGVTVQVVVFVIVSVALISVVRPIANRHRSSAAPAQRTGVEALKGRQAEVLERVDGTSGGRIKLAGQGSGAGPGLRARSEGGCCGYRRRDSHRHVSLWALEALGTEDHGGTRPLWSRSSSS
jgi:membrane protein implicated in regulation of membrane protease activity